jgi:hypothetical protein
MTKQLLLALLLILQVLDIAMTLRGLAAGAVEVTPWAAALQRVFGPALGTLIVKLAAFGALLWYVRGGLDAIPLAGYVLLVVVYVFVVVNNVRVLRRT